MFKRYSSFALLALLATTTTTNPDCSLESAQFPTEPVCSELSPNVQASNGWRNVQASQTAEGELFFSYKARPAVAGLDGLLAIAPQGVGTFSDAAILVRFAPDGVVDARNGSIYESDLDFPYEPGVWYDISISADLSRQVYNVDIGRCGENRTRLITAAAFRSDAPDSSQLTHWAVWSSQSATLDVATASWGTIGSCQPSTCQSLGRECGSASDGCGGTLSCGGCASGESCSSGTCVANSTPPPSGGNWWEVYDEPDATNTGPNCSAPGCPSATLTDLGSCPMITTNGTTLENFKCDGRLTVDADNVTLRNFHIDGGPYYGLYVEDGVTGGLFEYGEVDGNNTTNDCLRGQGFTGRYLHVHHGAGDTMKAEAVGSGPLVIEHSYFHHPLGGHGDTFQVWPSADSDITVRYSSLNGGKTSIHWAEEKETSTFEYNWMRHIPGVSECGVMIYCDPGTTIVRNNLIDRGYAPCLYRGACIWEGNRFSDDFSSAGP